MCVQALLDLWLQLWQWVFQPAIGVLMLGAVRNYIAVIVLIQYYLIIFNEFKLLNLYYIQASDQNT